MILAFITRNWKSLLILVVALVLVAAGWWVRGTLARADQQAAEIKQQAAQVKDLNAKLDEAAKLRTAEQQLRGLMATLDQALYKEYARAKTENAEHQRRLASGDVRVRIPVSNCTNESSGGSAAGMDAGRATAELDPKAASDLESIANEGDDAIRALTAWQERYKTRQKFMLEQGEGGGRR